VCVCVCLCACRITIVHAGSSRQFSRFESSAGLETTAAILKRAAEFMPSLSASAAAVSALLAGRSPYTHAHTPLFLSQQLPLAPLSLPVTKNYGIQSLECACRPLTRRAPTLHLRRWFP
jgi:hypothetical protein